MLAIVIPYYKLTFFKTTLDALAAQTDKRFTVYIGNDKSFESPVELLNIYGDSLQIVYKEFDCNLGSTSLVKQWQRCIDLVNYEEWIMILGDDDVPSANVVAAFYDNFGTFEGQTNVIRFSSKVIGDGIAENTPVYKHPLWETAEDSCFRRISGQTRSSLSEHIFSKNSFVKFGFADYPMAFYSDDRAWLEFSDGKPIYTINEGLVEIRVSALSLSGREDNNLQKDSAAAAFFSWLLREKRNAFSKQGRQIMIHKLEFFLRRLKKISFTVYCRLLYYNLRDFEKKPFIRFQKRAIRALLNHSEK